MLPRWFRKMDKQILSFFYKETLTLKKLNELLIDITSGAVHKRLTEETYYERKSMHGFQKIFYTKMNLIFICIFFQILKMLLYNWISKTFWMKEDWAQKPYWTWFHLQDIWEQKNYDDKIRTVINKKCKLCARNKRMFLVKEMF